MAEKPSVEVNIDVDTLVRRVKEQVVAEFKHRCVIWYDIAENPDEQLPPEFERVCNQDGEPVFRDGAGNWKSVVTGKQIEVTSWCETPKRERC